jgi:exopolyphosphatase / guanosine-5'-triphosphate,3'-diphosphate pyrophosphatase
LETIASIDIGSNTLRLLVAEKTDEGYRPLFRDREIVRLGGNFYPQKVLSDDAMARAAKVLVRFKNLAEMHGAFDIRAVATGVLREAANSIVFLEKIREEANIPVHIISGKEEAALMARGVLSGVKTEPGKALIFDLGGGSTEFVFTRGNQVRELLSLPLGVVILTEKLLLSNPPTLPEQQQVRNQVRNILREKLSRSGIIEVLIGTAGTVTTLAAISENLKEYDPAVINGIRLSRDRLEQLAETLLSLNLEDRRHLTGLEKGRADLICAGILVILEIMDHFSQDCLWVSDSGLLEGIILSKV